MLSNLPFGNQSKLMVNQSLAFVELIPSHRICPLKTHLYFSRHMNIIDMPLTQVPHLIQQRHRLLQT